MSQLVYIPKINNETWLLMTFREEGTCLRDYTVSPPVLDRTHSKDELELMLKETECYRERLTSFNQIPVTDEDFWREEITIRNYETGLVPQDESKKERLQTRFKDECETAFRNDREAALRAVFQRWLKRFECVKNKDEFNHWDNDNADELISSATGIGWTSQLLKNSRMAGDVHYILTDCDQTKFSLVAMELGLGISSRNNLINPNRIDYIIPDGLALREKGYFTIIEVKGPQDERGLVGPMLQAACGALAVVAKKEMLQEIALRPGDLRPAFHRAEIPIQTRSLGIHILSAAASDGGSREPWTDEVLEWCSAVIQAFSQLEYIAYSFISEKEARGLTSMKTHYLITNEGLIRPSN